MPKARDSAYAATINRAAMTLLAMSFRPDLQSTLLDEVAAAVTVRGGRIDEHCLLKFDLRAVIDEIVDRTMAILSAALRERLPGIADEMDMAFGERLRALLGSLAQFLHAV